MITAMGDVTVATVNGPDHQHLYEIAAEQHGYFTARQARACGFSARLLAHHIARGRYERIRWGLYRLREYPTGPHDEVMAAWLAVGKHLAVVSHDSALDLLGLSDVIPDAVHLTVPRARRKFRPLPGTVVHTTTRPLRPGDVTEREGIRLTAPARTILDAAQDGTGPEQIELAVHQAAERGLIDLETLRRDATARGGRVARLIGQAVATAAIARLASRVAAGQRASAARQLAELLGRRQIDPLSAEAEQLGWTIGQSDESRPAYLDRDADAGQLAPAKPASARLRTAPTDEPAAVPPTPITPE